MKLQAALGASLACVGGPLADMEAPWRRTLELAESFGDVEYQLRALSGLWAQNLSGAVALARRFVSVAVMPADRLVGDRMIGSSSHFIGDQGTARLHLERVIADNSTRHAASLVRFQLDERLVAQAYLARILWLQGFPEQALQAAAGTVADAQATDYAISLCQALSRAACPIALWAGDLDRAEHYIGRLWDLATTHALPVWRAFGRAYRGVLCVKRGDLEAGIPLLRSGSDELVAAFSGFRVLIFLGDLAEGLGQAGQIAEGLATIDAAIDRAERTDEHWLMAEFLRIKGELIARREAPESDAAQGWFTRACELARQQKTLSWELRSAMSLARFCRDQDCAVAARECLDGVYSRFNEGFETADLKAAKGLLQQLS